MAAVIRLKRCLEEQPLDTLVLNCKKRKTDNSEENEQGELSTILKFAGTINNQDDIYSQLKRPTKAELENQFKKHHVDLNEKLRIQKQQDSKKSRYKVVNCLRSQNSEIDEVAKSNNFDYTIYDLETDALTQEPTKSEEKKYVYDLYYTTSDDFGEAHFGDYVDMYPYNDVFMYGSMRDNGIKEVESEDDSEDSNAEANWKNDYPDESDMESITEEDMLQAMKKCDLSDLSSDDGEEGFIYSVDSEGAGFEEDVDDSDVQRYGERYARFKARHKNVETTPMKDLYYGDIDEEEYYY